MRYPLVFGIAVTIVIVQTHSLLAKSSVEVGRVAKAITVMIATPNNTGSGVIIKREGNTYTILTAAHVVNSRRESYTITTTDGNQYQLDLTSIQKLPKDIDLAVVKFTSTIAYPVAKLGKSGQASEGAIVYAAGFPAPTSAITQPVYAFKDGKVIANSLREFEGGYGIVYSCNTLPGMSGGGIFDENGELIAIHGRGDVDTKFKPSGDNENIRFKTGNDLGVPIDIFVRLAKTVGVNTGIEPPAVVAKTQPTAADFFVSAVAKHKKGDARSMLADASQAVAIDPNFANGYNVRGIALAELGDLKGAITELDRAIQLNPNDAHIYDNRGWVRVKLANWQAAITDFDRAIKLIPNYDNAYNNRGIARYYLRDKQGALSDLDRSIQLNSNLANYYYNRAIVRDELGNKQGTLSDLNRAIEIDPNYADAYTNRGMVRDELGDLQGALSDFDRTIQLKSNDPQTYYNRGLARAKLGQKQGATSDLQQAANLFRQQGNNKLYQLTLEYIKKIQRSNSSGL